MDTRSPTRSVRSLDPSESVILTPFKERALEEQRLRDNLILSLTPGLKRQPEVQASVAPLNNDIFEIRSYLQDLSSALASRGAKNLTSQLLQTHSDDEDDIDNFEVQQNDENENEMIQNKSFNDRINTFNTADSSMLGKEIEKLKNGNTEIPSIKRPVDTEEEELQDEGSMDIINSPQSEEQVDTNVESISQENIPMTLSQQILAKIPKQRIGTKIRKLEPVSINGVSTAPDLGNEIAKDPIKNPFINEPINESPEYQQPIPETFDVDMEPDFPPQTDDMGPELPIENNIDYDHVVSPEDRIRQWDEGQNLVVSPMIQPTSNYEMDESIDPLPKIKPLGIKKLQDAFQNFLISNNIKLKDKTWKALQEVSFTVVRAMASDLDNGGGLIIPKRTNIIEMLQKYQVIPLDVTDSEMFAICSSYLTVEEMNELEIDWFG